MNKYFFIIVYFLNCFLRAADLANDTLILYLTESENYLVLGSNFAVTSNESELNFSSDAFQQQLFKEQFRFEPNMQFESLLTVFSFDKKHIKICFSNINQINCKLKVFNELIDGQLQINDFNLVIEIDHRICNQLINFSESLYLLVCDLNNTKIVQMIQENGTVFDEINISSIHPLKFDYLGNMFIIYEADTRNSSLILYHTLDNNKFSSPQQIQINYHEDVGRVVHIFLERTQIQVTFEYLMLQVTFVAFGEQEILKQLENSSKIVFRNREIICAINYGLTDKGQEYSYSKGVFEFSNTTEFPVDALQIQDLIFVMFSRKLMIMQNNVVNYSINKQFNQIISLQQLPFLIAVEGNGIITFYKIQKNKCIIKKAWSKYLYSLDYEDKPRRTELRTYDPEKPEILLQKSQKHYFQYQGQEYMYFSTSVISFGIPVTIQAIVPQNFKANNQFKLEFSFGVGAMLLLEKKKIIIVLEETNASINVRVYNSSTDQYTTYNLKWRNLSNTYACQFSQTFVTIHRSSITQFIFDFLSQSLKIIKFIDFQIEILQSKLMKNKIAISLSNCTTFYYHTQTQELIHSFNQFYGQFFFNECIQNYSSLHTLMVLNSTQITFVTQGSSNRVYRFNSIVECDHVAYRFIVYELIEQKIQIKIYLEVGQDLVFLYDVPLYNHTIRYPLRREINDNYLIIEATLEKLNFILVYNLHNSFSNVLVQIIEIDDRSSMSFHFLGSQYIYYVFNQTIFYSYFQGVQIKIESNSYKYVDKKNLTFILDSQIGSPQANYSGLFIIINKCQDLKFSTNFHINTYQDNHKREFVVSGIVGMIDDIKLLNYENICNISNPYQIQNTLYGCVIYHNKSCLTENQQIIIDIFGEQKILGHKMKTKNIVQIFPVSHEEYVVIFLDEYNNLQKYNSHFSEHKNTRPFLLHGFNRYVGLNKKVNNFFILEGDKYSLMSDMKILSVNDKQVQSVEISEKPIKTIDIFPISEDYIICSSDDNLMKLTLQSNLTKQFQIDLQKNQEEYEIFLSPSIEQICIINGSLFESLLNITFLVFYKTEQGNLYDLQLDLTTGSYNQKVLKTIRYGQTEDFDSVLYCSSDLIILKKYSNVYFYNLKQGGELIDSYYSIEIRGIIAFEKYNETHFVVVQKNENLKQKNITLVKIEEYSILCPPDSNLNNFNILLSNSVSKLDLWINFKQQNEVKVSYVLILLFDLIFIVLQLKGNKRRRNMLRL